MLTEQSIRILKTNGWSEDRHIDIDEYKKAIREKGFKYNQYFEEFIRKYGGLYVVFKRSDVRKMFKEKTEEELKEIEKVTFHFDVLELINNDYSVEVYKEIAKDNNKNLIPIGVADNAYIDLFMDEKGIIYICSDGEILGSRSNIEEFINIYLTRYCAEVIE